MHNELHKTHPNSIASYEAIVASGRAKSLREKLFYFVKTRTDHDLPMLTDNEIAEHFGQLSGRTVQSQITFLHQDGLFEERDLVVNGERVVINGTIQKEKRTCTSSLRQSDHEVRTSRTTDRPYGSQAEIKARYGLTDGQALTKGLACIKRHDFERPLVNKLRFLTAEALPGNRSPAYSSLLHDKIRRILDELD